MIESNSNNLDNIITTTLNNYCSFIDSNYLEKKSSYFSCNIDNSNEIIASQLLIGPWNNDNLLKTHISNLKSTVEVLSQTCTKYTMIATQFRSEDSMNSITEELGKYIDLTYTQYISILECPISWPLFDSLTKSMRSLYQSFHGLVQTIIPPLDAQLVRSATGVVWEKCEEIKKLPIANKAAYRRDIMEKISIAKDTLREFDDYVQEYNENNNNQPETNSDETNEDEDTDDDRNDQYSSDDVAKVLKCLQIMLLLYESLLLSLSLVTYLGDQSILSHLSPDSQIEISVSIAKITKLTTELIDATIDLGSELYPPLVSDDISIQYHKLRYSLKRLYELYEPIDCINIISSNNELLEKFNILKSNSLLFDNITF